MIQKSLNYSGMQPSKTPAIKAPLAAALSSLEVQLDQELARYRRTRGTVKTANPTSVPPGISFSTATATELPVEPKHQEISAIQLDTIISPVMASPIPETKPEAPLSANSSNIVPTTIKTESPKSPTEPDDYWESSEALLRSLTEEEPKTEKPKKTNAFLSPLGIGAMLLFLAMAVLLAVFIRNPKVFKFAQGGATESENSQSDVNSQTVPEPTLTSIPRYPDLANGEFPEVKNPNDVVALKPKPIPTVVIEPNPINPVVPNQPLQVAPVNPQIIPTPIPTVIPTPTSVSPQADADIKPGTDGLYHVVMDNSGDTAFAEARKAISDAYLSPDGKLIYLGAVTNKERAKQLVTELKGKGVSARIK